MGAETKIEWTDSTINFWWGCTKVGPGCDHCYADALDHRLGPSHFGVGVPRRKIKNAVGQMMKLHRSAPAFWAEHGRPRRVFVQSMSDTFDKEVPAEWFDEAWETINACHNFEIQLVTKRVGLVKRRLTDRNFRWPQHAGLIATVCTQEEFDRDVPRLVATSTELGIPWGGLSIEPLLGPMDITRWIRQLQWVIVGGESGHGARPMQVEWARSIVKQCQAARVSVFVKQMGADPVWGDGAFLNLRDRKGGDMAEWPEDLRVQEFPHA